MAILWEPKVAKRTNNIEMDMRNRSRPNPYFLTEDDIGCFIFGGQVKEKDVGLRCQLVMGSVGSVFQLENYSQRDKRTKRS